MQSQLANDFWQQRADDFVGRLTPVLVWALDAKGFCPTPHAVLASASWAGVCGIVFDKRLPSGSDEAAASNLDDLPEHPSKTLEEYPHELQGSDPDQRWDGQSSEAPATLHAYNQHAARRSLLALVQ